MKRLITEQLKTWKTSLNRKPLIVTGVRQTGKTFILKEFGKKFFQKTHYINFEKNVAANKLFDEGFDPKKIITDLSFLLKSEIDIKKDLLIFDEIQTYPKALTSLKYFAEDLPEFAVCSAGSLLGLHLGEASFPVGKVDFLHMRPMCFAEFLNAVGDSQSLNFLNNFSITLTSSHVVHAHLWEQLKIYFITGGLPEVVQIFIDNKNDLYKALTLVRQKQNDLIYGYYADIAKHSGKENAMHIDRVWQAVPSQLAQSQDGSAKRFHFKGIISGIDRYQRLAGVLDWLQAAELIIKVPIIEHVELPLKAYTEESFFKLYLFDIGILGSLSGLEPETILNYDYGTYKGYFAENFVAQEFFAKGITNLFSWQNNRSEIEFLYPLQNQIIPIEVKSGWVTRNQSLNKYAEKYHPPFRVTFSAKNLNVDLKNNYFNYPLYMSYWLPLT